MKPLKTLKPIAQKCKLQQQSFVMTMLENFLHLDFMDASNKLECLYLESLSSMFVGKARSIPLSLAP
jgi:hypothetical protein